MAETPHLQLRGLMEHVTLLESEVKRHSHLLYLPNGTMPLTQSVALLTQQVTTLTAHVTALETSLDVLDTTMTAQHAALSAQLVAVRLSLTRYASLGLGIAVMLQVVIIPFALKWLEKLLK